MTNVNRCIGLAPWRMREFLRDGQGVAAVEFAVILPFMLLLYIGGVVLGDGMAIQVKVTDTAHAVADITSQDTSINNAAMSQILNASSQVIAPYASAPYSASSIFVRITEVSTDAAGVATVTWSDALNGIARVVGTPITLPSSLAGQPNISLILGEVSYSYAPNLGYGPIGSSTTTISDSYFLFPRNSTSITRVNS